MVGLIYAILHRRRIESEKNSESGGAHIPVRNIFRLIAETDLKKDRKETETYSMESYFNKRTGIASGYWDKPFTISIVLYTAFCVYSNSNESEYPRIPLIDKVKKIAEFLKRFETYSDYLSANYAKDISETTGVPLEKVMESFLSEENTGAVNALSIRIKQLGQERTINLSLLCNLLNEISTRIYGMDRENSIIETIARIRPTIPGLQMYLDEIQKEEVSRC